MKNFKPTFAFKIFCVITFLILIASFACIFLQNFIIGIILFFLFFLLVAFGVFVVFVSSGLAKDQKSLENSKKAGNEEIISLSLDELKLLKKEKQILTGKGEIVRCI